MKDEKNLMDYNVKFPKWRKLIATILISWVIILFVSFFLCGTANAGPKAEIKIKTVLKESTKKNDNVVFFGEIPTMYSIPEEYEPAAIGEFKTGIVTAKCDFDVLMKLSKEKCKELNYDGYALAELKQPSILNTCYQSKIIFLIALKR